MILIHSYSLELIVMHRKGWEGKTGLFLCILNAEIKNIVYELDTMCVCVWKSIVIIMLVATQNHMGVSLKFNFTKNYIQEYFLNEFYLQLGILMISMVNIFETLRN